MKFIFAALLTVFSVNVAFAANSEPEFCKMMSSYSTGEENPSFNTLTIDLLKVKTLSAFHLNLVNEYLVSSEYLKAPATLKEIQAHFKTEEQFNDLYLKIRTSKENGESHIEVLSYPGDNAAGTVYDAKTGAVLGHNGDDSYSYFVGEKEMYCSSEQ